MNFSDNYTIGNDLTVTRDLKLGPDVDGECELHVCYKFGNGGSADAVTFDRTGHDIHSTSRDSSMSLADADRQLAYLQ